MMRILLVDDHAVVRAGYRRFLERYDDMEVIAEAADAESAYPLFCQHQPDVTVVDVSMAGMGGIALIRRMQARDPSSRALVFSMHDEVVFVGQALQAGALGYVSKSSSPEVLVEAVRAVRLGQQFLSSDVAHVWALAQTEMRHSPLTQLSTKEFEVFRLLACGQASADIATLLCLSRKTVANYTTQIKDKLGVNTTAALVHLAWRYGVLSPTLTPLDG